jgi:hypothetical protein
MARERVAWIAKGSVGGNETSARVAKECLGVLRMILARDFLFKGSTLVEFLFCLCLGFPGCFLVVLV